MQEQLQQVTDIYYRIRFLDLEKVGTPEEYYISRNGTTRWESITQVKALLTRGRSCGYQGRLHRPFENYEIVEIIDTIKRVTNVIVLDGGFKVKRKRRRINKNVELVELAESEIANIDNDDNINNDNNNEEEVDEF
jgi:hypothetical protein